MTFDEIMTSITSGLTGDNEKDIQYLTEKFQEYKDHEYAKEIARACGRILYDLIPEEKREEIGRITHNHNTGIESVLEEARFCQHQKDFEKGLKLIEDLVNEIEQENMFDDDQASEYHCFHEPMEEILYREIFKPTKDLRQASSPYDAVFLLYGSLLIDNNRIEEANKALEKAVRWCPTSSDIWFEYTETFKMLHDLKTFYEKTLQGFRFATTPSAVARCYRNLGYFFIELELWEEAHNCYIMSLQFERESQQAMSELYYISTKCDKKLGDPSIEELNAMGEKYGIPIGADDDVLGIAYAYGKHLKEEGDKESARYFLNILYSLTDDEDIKVMLDELDAPLN